MWFWLFNLCEPKCRYKYWLRRDQIAPKIIEYLQNMCILSATFIFLSRKCAHFWASANQPAHTQMVHTTNALPSPNTYSANCNYIRQQIVDAFLDYPGKLGLMLQGNHLPANDSHVISGFIWFLRAATTFEIAVCCNFCWCISANSSFAIIANCTSVQIQSTPTAIVVAWLRWCGGSLNARLPAYSKSITFIWAGPSKIIASLIQTKLQSISPYLSIMLGRLISLVTATVFVNKRMHNKMRTRIQGNT